MRPGAESFKGFLGEKESLLDVMAADNKLVVDDWKRTHQELARHMRGAGGHRERRSAGRNSSITADASGSSSSCSAVSSLHLSMTVRRRVPTPIVRNLDSGKEIRYSLLVPDMVERYGFYEVRGLSTGWIPRKLLGVLDFVPDKAVP